MAVNSLRKMPVGIQSFEDLRNNGYVYVDKTQFIWDLKENGKSYFLSRPRRFGKSLFLSTMEAYFLGKKELFHGLAIEKLENQRAEKAWTKYPVVSFYLSGGNYHTEEGLNLTLGQILSKYEAAYQSNPGELDLPNRFRQLIETIYRKTGKQTVVLVDEYDKPLLEAISDTEQEEKNRKIYKSFFSVLKDEDSYLKFVFFTGVTKFSKVSIFSDLNQLKDISLNDETSEICGLTESELLNTFRPEIKAMADQLKVSQDECLHKLADMYDGYHFSPKGTAVYNPFSILNAFQDKRLRRYWYETGTPNFLLERLKDSDFTPEQLEKGVDIDEQSLMDYRADNPDPIPLFYQSGYLTICGFDDEFQIFTLHFPNNEVKFGFLNSLAPYVIGTKDMENPMSARKMVIDLRNGDLESFLQRLEALFAGIPYVEGKPHDYEPEWRNQLFIILTLLGQYVRCEVHSAHGRADCVIETGNYVYILEFKLDKTAEEALDQIKRNEYAKFYSRDPRKIIMAGINFSTKKKNIGEWRIEEQKV